MMKMNLLRFRGEFRGALTGSLSVILLLTSCVTPQKMDLAKAKTLAEQGDADAEYFLGKSYAKGDGVPQAYSVAAEYYRKAAEQGHVEAENNLAALYANGQGVNQDWVESDKWLRKAAEAGDAIAQFNLGNACATGHGM